MPKAKKQSIEVMFSELQKNPDRILISVYQTGTFRDKVDTFLKNDITAKKKQLVQGRVREVLDTIKSNINTGINGASETAFKDYKQKRVAVNFSLAGSRIGEGVNTSRTFTDLAQDTVIHKRNRPGRGKFYLDHGVASNGRQSLRSAVKAVRMPKITGTSKITSMATRKLKKKEGKIDFTISLGIAEMPYPLDEMVRRPLITGRPTLSDDGPVDKTKLAVLAPLEYGASRELEEGGTVTIPPRRWISKLAAEVGREMFKRLNSK